MAEAYTSAQTHIHKLLTLWIGLIGFRKCKMLDWMPNLLICSEKNFMNHFYFLLFSNFFLVDRQDMCEVLAREERQQRYMEEGYLRLFTYEMDCVELLLVVADC